PVRVRGALSPPVRGPAAGAGLSIAGDPPVLLAERRGIYRVGPPGTERLVLVNLFDDRESDIGRSGGGEWPARRHARSAGPPLARLYLETPRPAAGSCLIAGIDVSASVGRAAADGAREFLGRMVPALAPGDVLGSIAFAGQAHVQAYPTGGRRAVEDFIPAADEELDELDTQESDLAVVLTRAASLCPAGKQAALLLFSDGNETAGSHLAEATLVEPRIPVFPVVPTAAAFPPAVIRRLLAPALAPARSVLPL